jgi:hypothetical protein
MQQAQQNDLVSDNGEWCEDGEQQPQQQNQLF